MVHTKLEVEGSVRSTKHGSWWEKRRRRDKNSAPQSIEKTVIFHCWGAGFSVEGCVRNLGTSILVG